MLNTMIQPRTWLVAFLCLVVMAWTGVATAQMPVPDAASQFDIDGFLQEATLTTPANPLSGGTLKVNGHSVIVPANTIVIFPANALTWQEVFAQAPAPWGIPGAAGVTTTAPSTGLAMSDCASNDSPCTKPPLTTYEVHVVGNKAPTSGAAADRYIAGLVYISQAELNSGQGYITHINYGTPPAAPDAELEIATGDLTNPITRIKINDPPTVCLLSGNPPTCPNPPIFTGRYSVGLTPDKRFTVDQDNPTIASETGFPMCLPRIAPAPGTKGDDLCPEGNRPVDISGAFAGSFTTLDPRVQPSGSFPDQRVQAPMEVGDYITFAGTLVKDAPAGGVFAAGDGPTVGPWPGVLNTYVSAHTITNNIAIYTFPGTNPAYISTGVFILGTGGTTVLGVQEATKRTRFEGMMTDPSRIVHLYAMDLPCAADLPPGTSIGVCDRDWGMIGVDQGAPTGAVKGRWRFRPPCAPFGTDPASIKFDKQCIMNQVDSFLPATREMRAVIAPTPGSAQVAGWVPGQTTTFANGIIAGQYHAPILEYLFPEQIVGNPVPAANFETIPFLAAGGYTSSGGTTAPGPLNPWPGTAQPCGVAPTASALANPTTVFSPTPPAIGALVTLDASGSTGGTLSFLWTQNPADSAQVLPVGGVAAATATFNAPTVPANTTLNFTVTVTNCAGTSSASVVVNVVSGVPLVNHVTPVTFTSGTPGIQTIPISGVDANNLVPLTFAATQSGGGAFPLGGFGVVQGPNPPGNTANINFTVPTLPLGTVAPDVIQLAITATNTVDAVSPTEFTTVTVNPQPDIVSGITAVYRISKQRLTINAADSVISPNIVLTLQPYLTQAGTIYNPCPSAGGVGCVFVPNGAGLYLLDLVGAQTPACNPPTPGGALVSPCTLTPMTIKTNIPGGGSAPFGITTLRQ